jgi:hypothetical protein
MPDEALALQQNLHVLLHVGLATPVLQARDVGLERKLGSRVIDGVPVSRFSAVAGNGWKYAAGRTTTANRCKAG